METKHCFLCNGANNSGIKINEENRTTHSGIDLLMFLMILFDVCKENLQNNNVCEFCFETINELDFAKERSKELTHILLNYWNTKPNEQQHVIVKKELIDEVESDETLSAKQFEVDNLLGNVNNSLLENNEVQIKVENQDVEIKSTIVQAQNLKQEIYIEEQIVQQEVVHYADSPTNQAKRLFGCELCDKQFKQKKSLNIHMGVHTKTNAYICDICNKSFNHNEYLRRHMIVHTDRLPYECKICKRKFKYRSSFTKHGLSHTNNRNFACSICNYSFKSKIHLKNHMNNVHFGEYQHECEYCERKFKRPSHLQRHHLTHSKNKLLHYCRICDGTFKSEQNLKTHILFIHKDQCESKENIDMSVD